MGVSSRIKSLHESNRVMPSTVVERHTGLRTRPYLILIIVGVLSLSFTLSVSADSTPTPSPAIRADYWPTDAWRTSSPEDQQMDSQQLAAMLDDVQQQTINLHSLLVIRHGYIVSETYFLRHPADELHDLFSVTKSFVSTLTGIAIDQGYIDTLDHPVLDFFPDKTFQNVDDRKRAMTLRDLITMQTGLDWTESMLFTMERSPDWVSYVLSLPMIFKPGTHFNYCTGCSHIVSAIIQKTTGMSTREFAETTLFKPLGIADFNWRLDPQTIPMGGTDLQMSARDMAKLGYLFLHNGQWDGQTIVSSEWVDNATSTQVKTDSGLGYGLMWWTYPGLKAYAALGYNGQTVFVIPELDLIVVTTAATLDHGHNDIFALIEKYIVPAVQDAPPDF